MRSYDPRADLAPRDIVARGIYDQMRIHDTKHVYLDVTHLTREQVEEEFPHISGKVRQALGLEMSETWVPVVPAQHYACGGIWTNTDGETSLKGLYAIGESACTGVHGANRLASNSLLEGLVFGKRAVTSALMRMENVDPLDLFAAEHSQMSPLRFNTDNGTAAAAAAEEWEGQTDAQVRVPSASLDKPVKKKLKKVKKLMWKYAGILRNDKDLKKGLKKVRKLKGKLTEEMQALEACKGVEHVELINMVQVAELVLEGAISRKHSAGLHCNVDRPEPKENANAETFVDANA